MATPRNKLNARTFDIVLWHEDATQDYAREALANTPFTVAYCVHDLDIKEDGTLKKPHTHYVYKIPTKRSIGAIANELQIDPCYVNTVKKEQEALLYLIHRGWNEKYQYPPEDVQGKGYLLERFKTLVEDDSEDDKVLRILKIIAEAKGFLSMTELLQMCCEKGVYPELRRGGYLFVQALKEHNENYGG